MAVYSCIGSQVLEPLEEVLGNKTVVLPDGQHDQYESVYWFTSSVEFITRLAASSSL